MEYRKHEIVYNSKADWITIIPVGDLHIGNAGFDLDAFKAFIEWMENRGNAYWLGMGDYIDAINYSDPRFDPKSISIKYLAGGDIDKMIQMQIADFCELIEPIKERCIGLLRGNHEETIRKYYHYDVLYEIVKELDLKRDLPLYDTAIVRLSARYRSNPHQRRAIDIFCAHGNVGGRTYGHKSNRINELHKYFIADIYLLAHSHIKQAQFSTQIFFNGRGQEKKKKIIDAYTGCFLRGYEKSKTSYIERWLYPPTDIGVVKIQIKPYDGDKHISI